MPKSSFKPPVLTSQNYDLWQGKVQMLLKSEKLWSIVSGWKLRPDGGSEDRPTKAQLEWDDEAERATAIIFLCLGDAAERQITGLEDPVAIWAKLKEIYSMSGFSARCNIWVRLFSMRSTSYDSAEKYVDEIRTCCQLLKASGFEVHDEIQCSALIHGLHEGYEPFIAAVSQSYRRKNTIMFDELVSQLFDEQRRLTSIAKYDYNTPTAMAAKPSREPLICWHCKKPGHKEENCYEKYPEKRPGQQPVGKVAATFSTNSDQLL
jgi:hypothetical protein